MFIGRSCPPLLIGHLHPLGPGSFSPGLLEKNAHPTPTHRRANMALISSMSPPPLGPLGGGALLGAALGPSSYRSGKKQGAGEMIKAKAPSTAFLSGGRDGGGFYPGPHHPHFLLFTSRMLLPATRGRRWGLPNPGGPQPLLTRLDELGETVMGGRGHPTPPQSWHRVICSLGRMRPPMLGSGRKIVEEGVYAKQSAPTPQI